MKKKSGFTLIELSIVLVIISLIVGGVLVGQDLIYQAKVRSVISDVEKFKTAINTFRVKYNCIPGDCKNAYQFFGSSCGTNNSTMVQDGCNGDGNKRIASVTNLNAFIGDSVNESLKFWTHLNLAGFGPKTTGAYLNDPIFQVGINIPSSSFSNAGYSVVSWGWNHHNPAWSLENNVILASNYATGSGATNLYPAIGPLFTPLQALAIDQKIDDGAAYSGKLTGYGAAATPALAACVNDSPPTYNTGTSDNGCYLVFFGVW